MNILITGGAGYIGSHTAKALKRKGYFTVVYDNLSSGHEYAAKGDIFIKGDIFDSNLLADTIKKYDIDAVIHFAAYSLVGESMANPKKYYTNNVQGTLNLLNTMLENNINKIVFSSTAAVYGEPKNIPITEDCPKDPTNVYGKTKLMIENMLEDYSKAYALKYIALRYFNACGADPQGDIGEDHNPETHLIPLVLQTCADKRESIKIFGQDYPTKDGTCIRDYIHVNDLASAHVLALEALHKGHKSDVYNLGNGNGFSVAEIIDNAEKVTGIEIKKEFAERRSGDPAILIASPDKIKKDLGWNPMYKDISKIIQTAWNWHKNR